MSARMVAGMLIVSMIVSALAGCNAAPVLMSPPVQSAMDTSPASTPVPKTAEPTSFISSPAIETLEPTPQPTDIEEMEEELTPDSTEVPGVWVVDDEFGIIINRDSVEPYSAGLFKAYQYENQEELDAVKQELAEKTITIGQWEYYLDAEKPIEYLGEDRSYMNDYPVYRRNSQGEIEFLNIYGWDMFAIQDYLYVYSMEDNTGTDFTTCDTWRVKLDGSEIEYVGQSPNFYLPTSGKYLYFTNLTDFCMQIYRTDDACLCVERLTVNIPDWNDIEKNTDYDPIYECNINYIWIDNIDLNSIYFTLKVFDDDFTVRYFGKYKMLLAGGLSQKTDEGEYFPPDKTFEEE